MTLPKKNITRDFTAFSDWWQEFNIALAAQRGCEGVTSSYEMVARYYESEDDCWSPAGAAQHEAILIREAQRDLGY